MAEFIAFAGLRYASESESDEEEGEHAGAHADGGGADGES